MLNERTRSRNRRRVVAASVASFLVLLGYEAARLHGGSDPALAHSNSKASASRSKQSTTSTQPSTTSTQDDGGYSNGGQDYYTPPASDQPTTGSS